MAASSQLLPSECDAPPYPIIAGCKLIGLTRPEDVRWCRTTANPSRRFQRWVNLVSKRRERMPPHRGSDNDVNCRCRGPAVFLWKYQFTLDTGQRLCYRLGQCGRCLTVYWEDA